MSCVKTLVQGLTVALLTSCAGAQSSPTSGVTTSNLAAVEATFMSIVSAIKADPLLTDKIVASQQKQFPVTTDLSKPAQQIAQIQMHLNASFGSVSAFMAKVNVARTSVSKEEVKNFLAASKLTSADDLEAFAGLSFEQRLKILAASVKVQSYLDLVAQRSATLALQDSTSESSAAARARTTSNYYFTYGNISDGNVNPGRNGVYNYGNRGQDCVAAASHPDNRQLLPQYRGSCSTGPVSQFGTNAQPAPAGREPPPILNTPENPLPGARLPAPPG